MAHQKVYNFLTEIAEYYKLLGEQFKSTAFSNAAETVISNKHIPIKNFKLMPGIGKSTLEEIKEFIAHGTTKRYQKLSTEIGKRQDLAKIPGVGKEQLKKFHQAGINTIDDLIRNPIGLTSGQKLGLKYLADLKLRVPRPVTEELTSKLLAPIKYDICGSYRRGLETSGDIDVLVDEQHKPTVLKKIHNSKALLGILSEGPNRVTILLKDSSKKARQMDIKFTSPESYGAALLYFTGSKNFNKGMRSFAKRVGYILNEYGLFTRDKKTLVASKTEKSIFAALGLPFVNPTKRENFHIKA